MAAPASADADGTMPAPPAQEAAPPRWCRNPKSAPPRRRHTLDSISACLVFPPPRGGMRLKIGFGKMPERDTPCFREKFLAAVGHAQRHPRHHAVCCDPKAASTCFGRPFRRAVFPGGCLPKRPPYPQPAHTGLGHPRRRPPWCGQAAAPIFPAVRPAPAFRPHWQGAPSVRDPGFRAFPGAAGTPRPELDGEAAKPQKSCRTCPSLSFFCTASHASKSPRARGQRLPPASAIARRIFQRRP